MIRRPLVAIALEALLSVACEGEQAATPSAATSSPSDRGRSQPSAFAECVAVVPGADIQPLIDADPAGGTFCFAKGLYQLTSTIQTKERTPTFDLRAGAVIDGGDGGGGESADRNGPVAVGGAGVDHNARIESLVPHTPEMTCARDDASS